MNCDWGHQQTYGMLLTPAALAGRFPPDGDWRKWKHNIAIGAPACETWTLGEFTGTGGSVAAHLNRGFRTTIWRAYGYAAAQIER